MCDPRKPLYSQSSPFIQFYQLLSLTLMKPQYPSPDAFVGHPMVPMHFELCPQHNLLPVNYGLFRRLETDIRIDIDLLITMIFGMHGMTMNPHSGLYHIGCTFGRSHLRDCHGITILMIKMLSTEITLWREIDQEVQCLTRALQFDGMPRIPMRYYTVHLIHGERRPPAKHFDARKHAFEQTVCRYSGIWSRRLLRTSRITATATNDEARNGDNSTSTTQNNDNNPQENEGQASLLPHGYWRPRLHEYATQNNPNSSSDQGSNEHPPQNPIALPSHPDDLERLNIVRLWFRRPQAPTDQTNQTTAPQNQQTTPLQPQTTGPLQRNPSRPGTTRIPPAPRLQRRLANTRHRDHRLRRWNGTLPAVHPDTTGL